MYLRTDYLLCFHLPFKSSRSGGFPVCCSVFYCTNTSVPGNGTGVRGWAWDGDGFWREAPKEYRVLLNLQSHCKIIKYPGLEETHQDPLRWWNKLWESSGTWVIIRAVDSKEGLTPWGEEFFSAQFSFPSGWSEPAPAWVLWTWQLIRFCHVDLPAFLYPPWV